MSFKNKGKMRTFQIIMNCGGNLKQKLKKKKQLYDKKRTTNGRGEVEA